MGVDELQRHLDDMFDQALIYHGFTDYMRDYEMIVHGLGVDGPLNLRFRFLHCVVAEVETSLTPELWGRSLDDALTDCATAGDINGFVWGVKWQELYPGASLVPDSPRAAQWTRDLGLSFHEVLIETNAVTITLVFAELAVDEVAVGYTPFAVS